MSATSALSVLRRHRLAARLLLAEAVTLALAWGVITRWSNELANVVFGLLVVFAVALALLMVVVGGSIGLSRLRRG